MADLVLTERGRVMVAAQATGGNETITLATCSVRLFKNQIAPGPNTKIDDLDEATFPGYAKKSVITWDTPLAGPGSIVTVEGQSTQFVCNGTAPTPETIYGAFLAIDAGANGTPPEELIALENFDVPVGISEKNDGVRYAPKFTYP